MPVFKLERIKRSVQDKVFWIGGLFGEVDFVVEVGTCCHSRLSDIADDLSTPDPFSVLNLGLLEMPIASGIAISMIDDDMVPKPSVPSRKGDDSIGWGYHRCSKIGCDVNAFMELPAAGDGIDPASIRGGDLTSNGKDGRSVGEEFLFGLEGGDDLSETLFFKS